MSETPLEPCRGHYLRHQGVVLATTRADGVDLFLHAIAASQPPKAAHQADVVCSEPADREDAKPAGRKHRQQGTVLELADDAGPQALRLEPVVQRRSRNAPWAAAPAHLFILGISALIAPLVVNIQLIRQEVPIMIGASLLLLALGLDGRLSFFDGGILFVLLLSYTVFLVVQSRRETQAAKDEYAHEIKPAEAGAWDDRLPAQLLLIGAGLAALVHPVYEARLPSPVSERVGTRDSPARPRRETRICSRRS